MSFANLTHIPMEITEKSLKNILQEQREEFTTHVDKKIEEQREEFQRSVGVIAEDFRHDMAAIGEQYNGINNKIDGIKDELEGVKETLDSHTEMIVALKEDVEIIKTDVEFIKGALKKKVDYEEFAALEKRLTLLESKMHHLKQNHA